MGRILTLNEINQVSGSRGNPANEIVDFFNNLFTLNDNLSSGTNRVIDFDVSSIDRVIDLTDEGVDQVILVDEREDGTVATLLVTAEGVPINFTLTNTDTNVTAFDNDLDGIFDLIRFNDAGTGQGNQGTVIIEDIPTGGGEDDEEENLSLIHI